MKNFTAQTTIEPELNEKLEECMKEEDRSRSQIVRRALIKYLEAEKNGPAIACVVVDLVAQINKLQRDYGNIIPTEDMTILNEKLAELLAAERG